MGVLKDADLGWKSGVLKLEAVATDGAVAYREVSHSDMNLHDKDIDTAFEKLSAQHAYSSVQTPKADDGSGEHMRLKKSTLQRQHSNSSSDVDFLSVYGNGLLRPGACSSADGASVLDRAREPRPKRNLPQQQKVIKSEIPKRLKENSELTKESFDKPNRKQIKLLAQAQQVLTECQTVLKQMESKDMLVVSSAAKIQNFIKKIDKSLCQTEAFFATLMSCDDTMDWTPAETRARLTEAKMQFERVAPIFEAIAAKPGTQEATSCYLVRCLGEALRTGYVAPVSLRFFVFQREFAARMESGRSLRCFSDALAMLSSTETMSDHDAIDINKLEKPQEQVDKMLLQGLNVLWKSMLKDDAALSYVSLSKIYVDAVMALKQVGTETLRESFDKLAILLNACSNTCLKPEAEIEQCLKDLSEQPTNVCHKPLTVLPGGAYILKRGRACLAELVADRSNTADLEKLVSAAENTEMIPANSFVDDGTTTKDLSELKEWVDVHHKLNRIETTCSKHFLSKHSSEISKISRLLGQAREVLWQGYMSHFGKMLSDALDLFLSNMKVKLVPQADIHVVDIEAKRKQQVDQLIRSVIVSLNVVKDFLGLTPRDIGYAAISPSNMINKKAKHIADLTVWLSTVVISGVRPALRLMHCDAVATVSALQISSMDKFSSWLSAPIDPALLGDNDSNIHVSRLAQLHRDIRTCLGEAMLKFLVPILQPLKDVLVVLTKCFEQDVVSEITMFDTNISSGLPKDTKSIASEMIAIRGLFLGLFGLTDIVQLKLDADTDYKIHMCAVLMSPDVTAFVISISSIRTHVDGCSKIMLAELVSHVIPALNVARNSLALLQTFCGKYINEAHPEHQHTKSILVLAEQALSKVETATVHKIHDYFTKLIEETHAMLSDSQISPDFDFASYLETDTVDSLALYKLTQNASCRSLLRRWLSLKPYVSVTKDLYGHFSKDVHSTIKLIADCIASKIPAIQTIVGCCMVVQATSRPLSKGDSRVALVQHVRATLRDEKFPVLPDKVALFMERIQKEAHATEMAAAA